jgi:hypothetical protein
MRAKRHVAALLLALACPAVGPAADSASRPAIVYRSDRLSVRLERVPLDEVLTEIAAASGAEVRGAPSNARDVTADFEDVPLPEALHRLLGDQNFMLRYGEGDRLRTIELFGGAGDSPTVSLSAASAPTRSPAAGSTLPQEVAVAMSALARHPPVPVDGSLAAALGSETATLHAALSKALRGAAGLRAEELANQIASEAKTAELRAKALSILHRLRATASAD